METTEKREARGQIFSHSLIWFGAAVSIAEILTGTLLAPLGFKKALLAIIIGHLNGCTLFYFAALIGAKTEKSAMETVKLSFGEKGAHLFSILNVLQLLGWTAVMIISGAAAAQALLPLVGTWIWVLVIAVLILLWLLLGAKSLTKLNTVVMAALFALTVVLSLQVFKGSMAPSTSGTMSFGVAIELSAVMPLSWLPLVSDYTRHAKRKKALSFTSTAVYFFASCWMYVIGIGVALFSGQNDITQIMISSGLGIAGLLIIILSTVTTTFLDVYSGGVSAAAISKKIPEKKAALVVALLGTLLALFSPMSQYENFLYLIGSVFAPMIAVQIVDMFMLGGFKRSQGGISTAFHLPNLLAWAIGFIIYRIFIVIDLPIGNTLPVMLLTGLLSFAINKILPRKTA